MSSSFIESIASLSPEWKAIFKHLKAEIKEVHFSLQLSGPNCSPTMAEVFQPFRDIKPAEIKCLIMYEDPNPDFPEWLERVYSSLKFHGQIKADPSNVNGWIKQGVFFIAQRPTRGDKQHMFWNTFTRKLMRVLDEYYRSIIYIFCDGAREIHDVILNGHIIEFACSNSTAFVRANIILAALGKSPIIWESAPNHELAKLIEMANYDSLPQILAANPALLAIIPVATVEAEPEIFTDIDDIVDDSYINAVFETEEIAADVLYAYYFVFTDGSATKTNKAGWGYVLIGSNSPIMDETAQVVHEDYNYVAKSGKQLPTNNRAELSAISAAIAFYLENIDNAKTSLLTIYSDSMYCINTITKWYPGWDEKDKADKKNLDIIEPICNILVGKSIMFTHVPAHKPEPPAGSEKWYLWKYNARADTLAALRQTQ